MWHKPPKHELWRGGFKAIKKKKRKTNIGQSNVNLSLYGPTMLKSPLDTWWGVLPILQ